MLFRSTGTITSVGTPTEKSGSGDSKEKERVIPVTIKPDDASVTESFQEVSVTVGLPSEKRENVLSVPVGALVALSPEQFGVEVVQDDNTTQRILLFRSLLFPFERPYKIPLHIPLMLCIQLSSGNLFMLQKQLNIIDGFPPAY